MPIFVRDEYRSWGGGLLPEYFLHCLPENQVVLTEYYLFFWPENGYLKKIWGGGATPQPHAPYPIRLYAYAW